MSPALRVWLAVLLAVLLVGLGAWVYQLTQGLAVTNMRNSMMWGLYITLFMYFVGLSAGGLIVASGGRLFGAVRYKPIVRLAVLEATVAVMLAALLLLPDIGRPDRVWHLFRYPHLTSPLIWDIAIVTVYFLISVTYVWLYTRADLARAGSRLAFGTGTSAADLARDERLKTALAWIGLPAAILLHSITAWIFGLQIARGFWYSAVMAPLFISSALVSGMGLMIMLALVLRRGGRLSFGDDLVSSMGSLLGVFIAVEGFLVFSEMLTAAYPGASFEAEPIERLLTGPYAGFFWFEVMAGLAVPLVLLAVRRLRMDMRWVTIAAALAVVGIFVHRLNIVLNGLSYATVPYPPGVSIGTAQPAGETSFALSLFYSPSLIEWLVVLGVLSLGALVFTAAALYLPLREGAAPGVGHGSPASEQTPTGVEGGPATMLPSGRVSESTPAKASGPAAEPPPSGAGLAAGPGHAAMG
jgi:molybdopterin-containing oxidoreductase family membrane subunit